jgi:multidrug efflux system membrane fusion protein
MKGKPRFRSFLLILPLSISAVFLLSGCGEKQAQSFQRPPAPVTVAAAVTRDVPTYIDAVGKTVAREMVSIQPQVPGRITEIHFTDGAELKKGDLLFTIDERPYQAALDAAEATLQQRKAELDLARIELSRVDGLVESKAIAKEDYDTRKNAVDVAGAQVQESEAAVETARLNLDYCAIRSPIDGRAGHRLVDLGNVVKPADNTPLLTIQRLDPIYADFTVTENDLTAVQQNMARGVLKVEVRLPDSDQAREGDLSFLDNTVQDGTGTVKLRATIENKDRIFWPGRFVNVRLVLSTLHSAVLVPASASQMSAQGTFVYVVKPDGTAEIRLVKLGQRQDELVVIAEGLKSGEQVIINGQLGVTPGGKVQPQPETQASSTGKAPGEKS